MQDAIHELAKDAAKLARGTKIVGLGSGSTVAHIVRALAGLQDTGEMEFIPTSLQIKIEAEKYGLRIVDEKRIPEIDIVFDGADQIDSNLYMIKGGGGALLKEKILISSAKRVVIAADQSKFVSKFTRPVPIEIHPLARWSVAKKLESIGGSPSLRTLEKGYPFVTENGNLILDATFHSINDPAKRESEIKNLAGVMEVGIFTRKADVYYKAKTDGSFEKITT